MSLLLSQLMGTSDLTIMQKPKSMSFMPRKPISPSYLLIFCLVLALRCPSKGILLLGDHTSFVFHHCSNQQLDDSNGIYIHARSTLLQKLVSLSSKSRFNKTFVMVGDRHVRSVSGLFQCRGDLDDHKCNECMKAAQNASSGLCGNSMAGRIQLSGCHFQYEAAGFKSPSPSEGLNHKICGEPVAEIPDFEAVRSKAFEALEDEVSEEGDHNHLGFYSIKQEEVEAMAQCDVGIGGCECAKCVVDAIHVVEEECHDSTFAQVFMELCYFSFEFHPSHEVHGAAVPPPEKKGFIGGAGKLLAIAIGAAAVLAMAFLCCRFHKKKDDDF